MNIESARSSVSASSVSPSSVSPSFGHCYGLLFLPIVLLFLSVGCGGTDETAAPAGGEETATGQVLKFSAIPDQSSSHLDDKLAPLIEFLSQELGITVEYVPARDYQASVEMFRNGDVHLAWFGGLTGVQARQVVPGARAIAQGAADPEYYSYFIAHESTGLERAEDLPDNLGELRFTFGSESSTSGRLMPEFFLRQQFDKGPMELFTEAPGFSGSHDRTVELVESGQFQAGVVNYKVYERRVAEGETDPDVCRVIWKTPYYADYNWTAHPELDAVHGEGFVDRLQQVLTSIDDPVLLAALPRQRLIPARNEDFDKIRQVALDLEMLRP